MPSIEEILNAAVRSNSERKTIRAAFDVAQQAHTGQKRLSGDEYITHPIAVARHLAELGMDTPSIAAALLHDTVEDTPVTLADIKQKFGPEIAFLVDGVTKLNALEYKPNQVIKNARAGADMQVNNLKKMFFAMAEDIRVILIKLADRHHNMKTLKYMPRLAQERIAMETLEIYAPIADRLGMGQLKGQLEDLAFPFVYPAEYRALIKRVREKYDDRINYVNRAKSVIARHLRDSGVPVADIHSRAKHYWSLYQKLQRVDMDLEKVFDLVAVRIIVPDIESCYRALGIIHEHYRPLPGRIKDYIALPKPNGYRSIHTTVFCEKGRIAEIQIRTPQMHNHAENGIAAHWAYSETGKRRAVKASAEEIAWVNQLRDFMKEIKTSENLKNIKVDFFKNRIFAFTPRGDIKNLPENATPIDFAYAVHSDLGHCVIGAKVNDKMVPIDFELHNGDVVEIIKSKAAHPSLDWLRFVKTAEARKRIRSWLAIHEQELRIRNQESGIKKNKISNIKSRISSKIKKSDSKLKANGSKLKAALTIEGQTGLMHRMAKCCSPIPGQNVCGYITRAKGVTVHLASCKNIKSADVRRLLNAKWI